MNATQWLLLGFVIIWLFLLYRRPWLEIWKQQLQNPFRYYATDIVEVCIVMLVVIIFIYPISASTVTFDSRKVTILGWRASVSSVRHGDFVQVKLPTDQGPRSFWKTVVGLPGDQITVDDGVFVRNGKRPEFHGPAFDSPNGMMLPGRIPNDHMLVADYDPFNAKMAKRVASDDGYKQRVKKLMNRVEGTTDSDCILLNKNTIVSRGWVSYE